MTVVYRLDFKPLTAYPGVDVPVWRLTDTPAAAVVASITLEGYTGKSHHITGWQYSSGTVDDVAIITNGATIVWKGSVDTADDNGVVRLPQPIKVAENTSCSIAFDAAPGAGKLQTLTLEGFTE